MKRRQVIKRKECRAGCKPEISVDLEQLLKKEEPLVKDLIAYLQSRHITKEKLANSCVVTGLKDGSFLSGAEIYHPEYQDKKVESLGCYGKKGNPDLGEKDTCRYGCGVYLDISSIRLGEKNI